MKILHISAFYSNKGNYGASNRFKNLTQALSPEALHIIAAPNYKSCKHKVLFLPNRPRILKILLVYIYSCIHKPDVIVSDLLPTIVRRKSRIIYLIHDVRLESRYKKRGLKSSKFLYKLFLRHADKVITVSNFTKLCLQKYYSGPIEIVYNGVRNKIPKRTCFEERKGLIYVAKNENRKRIDLYLDICESYYLETGERSVLISDYDGPKLKYCDFYNSVSDDFLFNSLLSSKHYVSTSAFEGFGMPLVEAAACGCNLAVTEISAHIEVLHALGCTKHLYINPHLSPSRIAFELRDLEFGLDVAVPTQFNWTTLGCEYENICRTSSTS